MADRGNGVIEAEEHADDDYVERGVDPLVCLQGFEIVSVREGNFVRILDNPENVPMHGTEQKFPPHDTAQTPSS